MLSVRIYLTAYTHLGPGIRWDTRPYCVRSDMWRGLITGYSPLCDQREAHQLINHGLPQVSGMFLKQCDFSLHGQEK